MGLQGERELTTWVFFFSKADVLQGCDCFDMFTATQMKKCKDRIKNKGLTRS